jgi:predicted DNA-binding transcriptional regulator AlpA
MSGPTTPLGEYWTTREVAKFLGIAESTVRAYATRGKMPEPDAYVGATKVWRQQTIKEWAARRPRKGKPRS